MAERTVEISEAARALGISTEAVRKRIKRGSLKAQKNGDGQWLVIMDEERLAAVQDARTANAQTDAANVASTLNLVRSSAAIEEALRDEVDVLRDEITFLRTEVGRLETIIVTLSQTVRLLDAPRPVQQPQMSWWHRLKAKFIGKG